ncbi:hypothetical protein [Streptomyces noursei]|uniref:hypothetical protein n=1 Tax=Streptomyces noursei TaxID=1971 RepID=UPI001672B4F8|nr:hypothetical protein [Streptomyces noursei]MCZ1019328.1 hypothetical protein [Streptomyces noursei]GGX07723.1 hypothetical protein GCM10010341_31420 [Streptomyces noursei]
MGRVAEAANSLAIAVAATAVGCTLVLELAPAHHVGSARPVSPSVSPAVAARTATTGRAAVTQRGPDVPEDPAVSEDRADRDGPVDRDGPDDPAGPEDPAAPGAPEDPQAPDDQRAPDADAPGADTAAAAPGPARARPADSPPDAAPPGTGQPPAGRIQVTAPADQASLRVNSSFPVAWTNTTGTEVDVWLNAAAGPGRIQRLALVSPRAGAGRAGEVLVTLPEVPPGPAYALEVTAGNGAAHAFSRPFAVTN